MDNKNIIIFDTETTGLNKEGNDRIIEYCFLKVNNDKMFHETIKPNYPISPKATDANGLTNMDLKKCLTFKELLPDLLDFLGDNPILVAHNSKFDKKIL